MRENIFKMSSLTAKTQSKDIFKLVLYIFVSSSSIAKAECTPTPDCASIGYSATSCEGKFARCPFDTSKLFCLPCDSSYKYTCTQNHMIGGVGNSCANKYASCNCYDNYSFHNGECISDCTIGKFYYTDTTCSSEIDNNKTLLGIVVKDFELIISPTITTMSWSPDKYDINTILNQGDGNKMIENTNGQANTFAITTHYGFSATNVAGVYCFNYTPNGAESTKYSWYLPAPGEIYNYFHKNHTIIQQSWDKIGTTIPHTHFWTSLEVDYYAAWAIPAEGYEALNKSNNYSVVCFKKI